MNNSELEKKLKAARAPVLEPDYAKDFARMVLAGLRSAPPEKPRAKLFWRPRLAWGFAFVACILIAFFAGHGRGRMETVKDILTNSELIQTTQAMFPNRVRAIVCDERGINLILSDEANVPVSPPIYVRICDGKNCSSLVTFSGQEIQIAGEKLTVLSEADGGIILEGNHFVWANTGQASAGTRLKIEARNLGPAMM
jgi:hypothetical protein